MEPPQSISAGCLKPLLPIEIHAATQARHTSLNKLITSRLPLCLPPHAPNAAAYLNGIQAFGQIYFAFERAWDEQIDTLQPERPICILLKQLRLSSLRRSRRLHEDLNVLRLRFGNIAPSETENDSVWRQRIKSSIQKKPHVVLAYAWVMYMALFNGGRWIRGQLVAGGGQFWDTASDQFPGKMQGLSFWDFDGDEDGNDIKDELRARFTLVSQQLGDAERKDVVDEALAIFGMCAEIVTWLDTHPPMQAPLQKLSIDSAWVSGTLAIAFSLAYSLWIGLTRSASSLGLKKPNLSYWVGDGVHTSS